MLERLKHGKLRWMILKNPTQEEIRAVTTELDISPIFTNDLATPVPKNSAIRIDTAIKITLDFPVIKRLDTQHPYEVKFIISKSSFVTVQYDEMEGIDRFKRHFDVATTLRKQQKNLTGADLFISVMNAIYESTSTKLDYIESKLSAIEDLIFKNNERKMVSEISLVSKQLITFRHILRAHEDIFRQVKPLFDVVYGDRFTDDLQNIQGQYFFLQRHTNTLFDTLTALRETNTAMLTTRQNEIIKNLTIMAFITFPLTLISSVFGMNTESSPIIGATGDFWIIVGIMVCAVVGFFSFFKYKGWI